MTLIRPEGDWLTAVGMAVHAGDVICLPTDTVYGIGADPFNADAVSALLTAKARTREKPSPVLVSGPEQAQKLVSWIPAQAHDLIGEFWPGALTIILPARDEVGWDLGETNGTVALRMPNHSVALEILRDLGPLAVTSANITGQPPVNTAREAAAQLGDSVAVYVDAGRTGGGVPSTILRFSQPHTAAGEAIGLSGSARIDVLRHGAVNVADISRIVGEVVE